MTPLPCSCSQDKSFSPYLPVHHLLSGFWCKKSQQSSSEHRKAKCVDLKGPSNPNQAPSSCPAGARLSQLLAQKHKCAKTQLEHGGKARHLGTRSSQREGWHGMGRSQPSLLGWRQGERSTAPKHQLAVKQTSAFSESENSREAIPHCDKVPGDLIHSISGVSS